MARKLEEEQEPVVLDAEKARLKLKRSLRATKAMSKGAGASVRVPDGQVWLIDLDKEWAELLMSNLHPNQRKANKRHVSEIVRALDEERFLWLGDPLRIDAEDRFVDGQHRAQAVIDSGVTIKNQILVKTNEPDALLYIDALHKARSLKDVQRLHGLKAPHTSIDAGILFCEQGFPDTSERIRGRLSKPEQAMVIEQFPHLDEMVEIHSLSLSNGVVLTAGPLAAAAACLRVDRDAAMQFWGAIASNMGEEFGEIHQARLFLRWFLKQKHIRGRTGGHEFIYESADRAIRAWNAWRQGQDITKIQRGRGQHPENVEKPV